MIAERRRQLVMGTFDAERFWRDPKLAKLPSIPDPGMEHVVLAMDELLFPFCSAGDQLITRYRMNDCHIAYLRDIGFAFDSNQADLEVLEGGSASRIANLFDLVTVTKRIEGIDRQLLEGAQLSPFAVIPGVDRVAAEYGLHANFPAADTVRHVNSKLFSAELNRRLGYMSDSRTVYSSEELLAEGLALLQHGTFLIKDEFGVSGKGNLLIESETILRRIASYLEEQGKRGKEVRFIIEPFLHKELDFSCQFYIEEDGTYRLIAVQQLRNAHFAYLGSFTADAALLDMLRDAGYFDQMKQVARELYNAGYYGDVCVDSMLLQGGRIVPVVEVNARRSMSLIKHHIDLYLERHSATGSMTHATVHFAHDCSFEQLLAAFEREGILYTPDRAMGVLPLSANTLFINKMISKSRGERNKAVKGRLYFSIVSRQGDDEPLLAQTRAVLEGLSFRVVG
ncbi:hypothetical protein FHS18_006308 [Paenibacillus phyllosphaerae]|uniref:ATP-grasp domain-containing protein n=1 Tax=Paenibacillus phyllosphaerae TaxID=274593 RepID=A0A7W5FR63_9BACL|nr:hypothetical protein [Paenibacillus phyllosphaerae]MBB3114190.1 hypothetical protein [Paenibacillus phyllosphaerae]